MGCFVRGGKNGMRCFVRGGKNCMGCFVRGGKNCMGCFVRGGKSLWDVLSRVAKNGMGCFVRLPAISSHTDHFEIQKRDSEESLLTFVNLFPSI